MHALDWLNERGCILGGAIQGLLSGRGHFYFAKGTSIGNLWETFKGGLKANTTEPSVIIILHLYCTRSITRTQAHNTIIIKMLKIYNRKK